MARRPPSPAHVDPSKNASRPVLDQSQQCLSLIGMPGSGKSTLAAALASRPAWAFLDTDHLLEAWYGRPLEDLRQVLGRENFLLAEERTLLNLDVCRCIIATGGSVIYSPQAMQALQRNGVVVYLQADYEAIEERVSRHPERGLVMGPGQSLRDLYAERKALYERYADRTLRTDSRPVEECIQTLEKTIYEIWSHEFSRTDDL